MTKAELISEISLTTGYEKKTIGVFVEAFTGTIKKQLIKGENVYLRGFGTFTTKTRAAKIARDILKERTVSVPEHKIPAFKPAAEFKEAVR